MRFDVNISMRRKGDPVLGTRTETKNLNSFKFMEDAIHKEVQRQVDILEDGGRIIQETRLYNGDTGVSKSMRSKEEANDYRYFPCPDLLPVVLTDDDIESFKAKLPELPDTRRDRFIADYKLSRYDASMLADNIVTASYFEVVAKVSNNTKLAANWVNGELASKLNSSNLRINESIVSASVLGGLISRIEDKTISGKIAKQVFDALWNKEGATADDIIEAKGLKQVSDTGAIEALINTVINANPAQVEQFRAADDQKRKKLSGFFVGQIMKASKGQANPGVVNQLLIKALNSND